MHRFEQRLHKRLQKKAIAEDYRAMGAELELMQALDSIRKQQHMSQERLAASVNLYLKQPTDNKGKSRDSDEKCKTFL